MFERVETLIRENLSKKEVRITMDTDIIAEFCINSLELAELVCAFEDEFNVRIPDSDIRKFRYVRDIVAYLGG